MSCSYFLVFRYFFQHSEEVLEMNCWQNCTDISLLFLKYFVQHTQKLRLYSCQSVSVSNFTFESLEALLVTLYVSKVCVVLKPWKFES